MTFALIFLIVLSLILLVGAYLIWKSDLPDNDKIISIIAILALFALVSIVNEAKKQTHEDSKYSLAELEKSFFTPKSLELDFEYRLPLLLDVEDWVETSIGSYNLEESNGYIFGLVIGEDKSGKTFAFQEYVKQLQSKKIPALYVDIKETGSNIFNLLSYLKIANLNLIEEAIQKFNDNGKIPCLVVDNIQNAFTNKVKEFEATNCPICEYLRILYDAKKINILMVTDRPETRFKLLANEELLKRLSVVFMKPRNLETLETYLLDKVNYGITEAKNRFTRDNISKLVKSAGFTWDLLNEYVFNQNKYNNVEEFSQKWLEEKARRQLYDDDIREVVSAVVSLLHDNTNKTYVNDWIGYGKLKKIIPTDLSTKLDKALDNGLLINNDGNYKFASNHALNVVLIALEKKKFEEL